MSNWEGMAKTVTNRIIPQLKSSAKIARLRDNGKGKDEKMNAWNLSRQSTMNCVSADNLTINSFVTYKSQSYAKYV